jgi:enoyl-[acyl-carrier protein] reductase I
MMHHVDGLGVTREGTMSESGNGNPGAGVLSGKNCVVMGIQNRWSIAYAIAEQMAQAGASIAVTYVDERAGRDALALAEKYGGRGYTCNVASDEDLDRLAADLDRDFGRVDALVHSIGYAPAAELEGRFVDTSRDGFRTTLDISCYSLVAAAQRIAPLMTDGGSILTLTYLGSDRAFPRYNVMGVAKAALESSVRYLAYDLGAQRVRVNAISAGPVKTAAARGIPGFADIYKAMLERAPLQSDFGAAQVGSVAVFLASDAAASITAETIFVDKGYHAMGM